ncbi:MAG: DUF2892 domain-containing protein [Tabrizicola sp.]|nr:DUF2892 domain-containing protein [Tabrizicola sp.]
MMVNVGTPDRALRLAAGAVLILTALFSGATLFDAALWKYGTIAVGLVMIATGALRFCPLYALLGIRTCRT